MTVLGTFLRTDVFLRMENCPRIETLSVVHKSFNEKNENKFLVSLREDS